MSTIEDLHMQHSGEYDQVEPVAAFDEIETNHFYANPILTTIDDMLGNAEAKSSVTTNEFEIHHSEGSGSKNARRNTDFSIWQKTPKGEIQINLSGGTLRSKVGYHAGKSTSYVTTTEGNEHVIRLFDGLNFLSKKRRKGAYRRWDCSPAMAITLLYTVMMEFSSKKIS